MKKSNLLIVALIVGLVSFGQSRPDNLDISIFANGTNGSNIKTGGYIEVSLRIKPGRLAYTSIPAAEDFLIYLAAPKTDFSAKDAIVISEVNPAIYGSESVSSMQVQGVFDLGAFDPDNLYFPVVLNSNKGMNLSSLSAVDNSWTFAFTFKFNNVKTLSALNKIRIIDQTNNTAMSNSVGSPLFTNLQMSSKNQLTSAAFATLPEGLLNLSGYKNGSKNVLNWTVSGEINNQGYEMQRSVDGLNYASIGFVNSLAPGGFSTTSLSYSFDDKNPAGKTQYYRLSQVDISGRGKLSNIVLISEEKPTTIGIGGLFPNPARSLVNVIIASPAADKVTLVLTDINGKTVKQQLVNVETGLNTIPVEIGHLAQGSYLVKVVCKTNCETAVSKFNKQ